MTAPGDFSSGEVLTAADMNGLPGGCVGYDLVEADVSLSSTSVTSHSVTYTRTSGRLYVAVFSALFEGNSVAGADYRFDIEQAGARRYAGRHNTSTASDIISKTGICILANTASGSETITVECSVSTGTGLLRAASSIRASLLVYDMGLL